MTNTSRTTSQLGILLDKTIGTHYQDKADDSTTHVAGSQRRNGGWGPEELRKSRHGVWVVKYPRIVPHQTQDMRSPSIIGVDTYRDHLTSAQQTDGQMAKLVNANGEKLPVSQANTISHISSL